MCECFGGKGYTASTPRELINIMKLINEGRVVLPVIVNVLVSPVSEKKQQVCGINTVTGIIIRLYMYMYDYELINSTKLQCIANNSSNAVMWLLLLSSTDCCYC